MTNWYKHASVQKGACKRIMRYGVKCDDIKLCTKTFDQATSLLSSRSTRWCHLKYWWLRNGKVILTSYKLEPWSHSVGYLLGPGVKCWVRPAFWHETHSAGPRKGLSNLLNVNLIDRNTIAWRSVQLSEAPSSKLDKLQAIGYNRTRKRR